MKSFLLIGLGKFGLELGKTLMDMGNEVMAVDKNEDVVNEYAPLFTSALCANCMNPEVLKSFDPPKFDVCIVTIGNDFQSSLEITFNLKELGDKWKAKYVVAKADTEIQKKFLRRNGADRIVYPYQDSANSLARVLNEGNQNDYDMLFKFTDVGDRFSVANLNVPTSWVGKTLQEINPRGTDRLNVLLVRRGKNLIETPSAKFIFEKGDSILAFGENTRLYAFMNKTRKNEPVSYTASMFSGDDDDI